MRRSIPSLGELLQFALNRSDTAAGETYDLPQIELLVGMPEKQPEHRAAVAAEECLAEEARIGDCTHNWFNCTILWCDRQVQADSITCRSPLLP